MIPECLKNKKIKAQYMDINVPYVLWEHVPKKKKYYFAAITLEGIKSSDLACVDLHGAPVRRIVIGDGTITLYSNTHPRDFNIDIYVIDDDMKVDSSTKDKHFMPDPRKD